MPSRAPAACFPKARKTSPVSFACAPHSGHMTQPTAHAAPSGCVAIAPHSAH